MSVPLSKICELIGAAYPDKAEDITFDGVSSIQDAGPREISFLSNPRYIQHLSSTNAGAVIVSKDMIVPDGAVPLVVDNPYVAFLYLLELFNNRHPSDFASGISPNAVIHAEATIGKEVSIGDFAVIGSGVKIGDGTVIGPNTVILKDTVIGSECIFYPNVTIMDRCKVGNRVILHAGVVIGSDGFGFAPFEGNIRKIPQIGCVNLGNDVEVGACSCIDRATFGETIIEEGTKIDNLVQIGHNVRIGKKTLIVSQAGISGSTTVGENVKIGGQAGVSGHLTIEDNSSLGAQAGVTKNVPAGHIVSGYPAQSHAKELRQEAMVRKLPDIVKKIKDLENTVKDLERRIEERR